MEDYEISFLAGTPEKAMAELIEVVASRNVPQAAEYNGVVMVVRPSDLATPELHKRLVWSLRMSIHDPHILGMRPSVGDLVAEVLAGESYLLLRLNPIAMDDPSRGMRWLADATPSFYCWCSRISRAAALEVFKACPAYANWETAPVDVGDESDEVAHVQAAMRYLAAGSNPSEDWVISARALMRKRHLEQQRRMGFGQS